MSKSLGRPVCVGSRVYVYEPRPCSWRDFLAIPEVDFGLRVTFWEVW